MIRTKAQRSPIGLVALVPALAVALYLAYQLSIGIPARARNEQEAAAQLLQYVASTILQDPSRSDATTDARIHAASSGHPHHRAFGRLDALHRMVHAHARQLLKLDRLDREALTDPITTLLQDRDALVAGIRSLQAEVMEHAPREAAA
ncbi:hypothetical protein [Thiocapsa sp.]|uniref:hypothetical protein n=1 Tax=Thiocapsa sp. TaxID=2024551 RepID=UPI002C453178|nr:hypothetical protein [Thiocapsa sp.]HSO84354.1 hypothetical protein [Thiocapsa sp.]